MRTTLLLLSIIMLFGNSSYGQLDPDKILLYLSFNDSIGDASGKGIKVDHVQGEVSFGEGKFGLAAFFDKATGLETSGVVFNPIESHSMAAWYKFFELPSVSGERQPIISQLNAGGQDPGRVHLLANTSEDRLDVISSVTDGTSLNYTVASEINVWYHIVHVKDVTAGKRYLYINGEKVNEVDAGSETNNTQIRIGTNRNARVFAHGHIDDVLITSQVLDATTIGRIMDTGVEALLTTSVREPLNDVGFQILPNPARGSIQLTGVAAESSYVIYSLSGQSLLSGGMADTCQPIDISSLTQGLYLIRLYGGKTVQSQRLIVY
jgi:hypothetical protein